MYIEAWVQKVGQRKPSGVGESKSIKPFRRERVFLAEGEKQHCGSGYKVSHMFSTAGA